MRGIKIERASVGANRKARQCAREYVPQGVTFERPLPIQSLLVQLRCGCRLQFGRMRHRLGRESSNRG